MILPLPTTPLATPTLGEFLALAADCARLASLIATRANTRDLTRIAARLYLEAAGLAHSAWELAVTDEEIEQTHQIALRYGRLGVALRESLDAPIPD